jgi:hypothetical protein
MSHHYLNVIEDVWFVAYTESRGTVHYGHAEAPATVTSGQQELETFATEDAMGARIDELKGISGWYEAHKPLPPDPDQQPGNVT